MVLIIAPCQFLTSRGDAADGGFAEQVCSERDRAAAKAELVSVFLASELQFGLVVGTRSSSGAQTFLPLELNGFSDLFFSRTLHT